MESSQRGSHTVWDCKYHLVWITKYRYQVLGGDVGQRCRELIRETAIAHEMVIHARSVNRDHVHLLISIPPSQSVSRAEQHLWARGYWMASSGNVTDEVWLEYIKTQKPPNPDDNLR